MEISLEQLVKAAMVSASSVWDDDEARSAANESVIRALRTYDGRVPLIKWICFLAKQAAVAELRKKRQLTNHDFDTAPNPVTATFLSDYPLLLQHYLESLTVKQLAEKNGWTHHRCWLEIKLQKAQFLRDYFPHI